MKYNQEMLTTVRLDTGVQKKRKYKKIILAHNWSCNKLKWKWKWCILHTVPTKAQHNNYAKKAYRLMKSNLAVCVQVSDSAFAALEPKVPDSHDCAYMHELKMVYMVETKTSSSHTSRETAANPICLQSWSLWLSVVIFYGGFSRNHLCKKYSRHPKG